MKEMRAFKLRYYILSLANELKDIESEDSSGVE